MRKFRIGVIGLGGMAGAHIRWMIAEGRFEIVAVSDVNADALAKVGNQLGIAADKRYTDFKQLIEDPDVDAVVSATPNNVHADIIRACLQASKPFMAEKPFTRVFEEATPLLELYEKQPVPAMFGFTYRYTPAFRYATGKMVKIEVDDYASFQARMTGDVMGVFLTTRNAIGSGNQHEVSIYGDSGTIHASTLNPDQLIWIREEAPGQLVKAALDVPKHCKVTQYADFLALLEGSIPDGVPGFMDGYRNQEILDAIVRASETKTVIPI